MKWEGMKGEKVKKRQVIPFDFVSQNNKKMQVCIWTKNSQKALIMS